MMLIHSHRREHVLKGLDGWMDGICAHTHMHTQSNKIKKESDLDKCGGSLCFISGKNNLLQPTGAENFCSTDRAT